MATLNQREAQRLLWQHGWKPAYGTKHEKWAKQGHKPITLPRHKGDYTRGVTNNIVKRSGLEGMDLNTWKSRSKYIEKTVSTGRKSRSSRDASRSAGR